ncbi:alpha-xylosidase [Amycolatopsis acidiphila]|uniref:alpha-D-xyloside xylohydrolase n=1 Tax=Amycolatopsis acidiphila TaxID=715473 RepID=A0A558AM66_9PSEU|nr:alpha-xylosidase [Amycolatopsis acidiphila]TVT25353.1 alpha-xylosidase [Amycolatopsis acidiphila]UIJ62484.1 alpha-xylosidase [Amycolatopsis acidiphila]GHG83891.1 alpha-xylosidase [Amycolatopsis acidiphila]
MKFTSGFWRMRDGVRALHPHSAHEVVPSARGLTVYAPTRAIENRRHSLNNPVITFTFWSPMDGVIGVRAAHHTGGAARRPAFELHCQDDAAVSVGVADDAAIMTSHDLSVRIATTGTWDLSFWSGQRRLTGSGRRSTGIVQTDAGEQFVHERLALDVGACVYGLGERSTALVKNGQSVDTWNDDGGPSSEHAYKSVPFYWTDQGYGVFVNSTDRVSFEVCSEFVSQVQFSVPGQELEYFVIAGDTPKEILRRYTALTGRPALPPAWSFGLWLSTSFVTSYDEATVTSFVSEMERRELPLSVFHFDSFWMREFHWCDFEWDHRAFPDPAGMLKRLKDRGLRVSVWINPYIAQQSALFREAQDLGYLLNRPNGDVWQWDTWQAGMGIVDFTNPAAREWFADKLRVLLSMGVDCFKTDFGERIPTDVVYHDGSDPSAMHNYYSYLYNQTVFNVLTEHHGAGEAVVFARSATAGGQRFPVHWGGDPEPTYVSMAESLRAGLSLGMSGFGFWSHDIGGFEGNPTPGLFKRWAAFGLLSSHSRLHGSISYRVPWEFGEEAADVVRHFTRLKMRLMPYLYGVAEQAHEEGLPMMRAMALEFPDDRNCRHLDNQYMLGPDLLVAPVFTDCGEVTYYVPQGEWAHLLTGRRVQGPCWVTEQHDFLSLPLLVRPGALVPLGSREDRPDYDYRDGVTLEVFTPGDVADTTVTVPSGSSARPSVFQVRRTEGRLDVRGPADRSWQVALVGPDLRRLLLAPHDGLVTIGSDWPR